MFDDRPTREYLVKVETPEGKKMEKVCYSHLEVVQTTKRLPEGTIVTVRSKELKATFEFEIDAYGFLR
jgi:hypothetical protein